MGVVFTTIAGGEALPAKNDAGIIPAPAKCEMAAGGYMVAATNKICWRGTEAEEPAKFLCAGLKERIGLELAMSGLTQPHPAPAGAIVLDLAPGPFVAEAYLLKVEPAGITLRAGSAAGLFYGVQSLLQMAAAAVAAPGNPLKLPAVSIEDSPRFEWRGLGFLPHSALELADDYADLDAERRFPVTLGEAREVKGCECPAILRGVKQPTDCKLFGTVCIPDNPMGSCMVSSEGACAAHYSYGRFRDIPVVAA